MKIKHCILRTLRFLQLQLLSVDRRVCICMPLACQNRPDCITYIDNQSSSSQRKFILQLFQDHTEMHIINGTKSRALLCGRLVLACFFFLRFHIKRETNIGFRKISIYQHYTVCGDRIVHIKTSLFLFLVLSLSNYL